MHGLPKTPQMHPHPIARDLSEPNPESLFPTSCRCCWDQPYAVRCLLARTRRLATGLPTVWEAFRRGDVDAEQIRIIDRVARRVTEAATLAAIDDQVIDAAHTRTPKQLQVWLLRLVVRLEPLAFEQRHRRALAERRVTVIQGADGIGYVTGEISAPDAAAIDGMLAATARSLGADDPRTDRNAAPTYSPTCSSAGSPTTTPTRTTATTTLDEDHEPAQAVDTEWLEIENIDPDTGELLGTHLQPIDANGQPSRTTRRRCRPPPTRTHSTQAGATAPHNPDRCVVPLSSLLNDCDTPAELADRSGFIPGADAAATHRRRHQLRSAATRCCSPGSSPTTAAGSSTPPNSAATPPPG